MPCWSAICLQACASDTRGVVRARVAASSLAIRWLIGATTPPWVWSFGTELHRPGIQNLLATVLCGARHREETELFRIGALFEVLYPTFKCFAHFSLAQRSSAACCSGVGLQDSGT